jgi:hypothetical protein
MSIVVSNRSAASPSLVAHSLVGVAGDYFFPDFLMPCEPVLSGPLPFPTDFAKSSRCFFSVYCQHVCRGVSHSGRGVSRLLRYGLRVTRGRAVRTSSELGLVGEILLVEFDSLLLLLLVVDGIGTGCSILSALTPHQVAQNYGAYLLVLKAS